MAGGSGDASAVAINCLVFSGDGGAACERDQPTVEQLYAWKANNAGAGC